MIKTEDTRAMRREYNIEESYIDYLKSIGCVFYAPLDKENQLKDLISGNIGQLLSGSVAQYDSSINGYTIQTNIAYGGGIIFNLNDALSQFYGEKYIDTEFTLIAEAIYYNSNTYFPLLTIGNIGVYTEYIGGYIDTSASSHLKQLALVKVKSVNGTSAPRNFYSNALLKSSNTSTSVNIMDDNKFGYVKIAQSNNHTGKVLCLIIFFMIKTKIESDRM